MKAIGLASSALILLLHASAAAQDGWFCETHLEIGAEYSFFSYEEHDIDGARLMNESGPMFGVRAQLIHPSPLYWRINGSYRWGELEYDGATQGGMLLTADTTNTLFDIEAVLGTDLIPDEPDAVIAFYSGLGFRRWDNEILGPGGYPRQTDYIYLPVGLEFSGMLGSRGSWGVRGQLDLLVRGIVRSDFSEFSPETGVVKNTQTSGYGLNASLFLRIGFGRSSIISVEPFIQYWQIDMSDVAVLADGTGMVEPANSTTVYGIAVSLMW